MGRKQNEDVSSHDLGFPVTTDPEVLVQRFELGHSDDAITVVFSTYQSIDVIHAAQQGISQQEAAGQHSAAPAHTSRLPEFDLVICDEAHRTTGISQPGADDSAFVRVHDNAFIQAAKRLYMTATPRIYVEDSRAKAAQDGVKMYSMDDESQYGPEFHHLGFGRVVELGHLSDYKVLILAVDEGSVASSFQQLLSEDGDLNLDDVARIVGCWNGLSKRGVNGTRLSITDDAPMNRAVAFARNIKESKAIADQFEKVGQELLVSRSDAQSALEMQAQHVDGTFNVLERSRCLDWLQILDSGSLSTIEWQRITPNDYGDGINQRDPHYEQYPLIGDKRTNTKETIFDVYGRGIEAGRDAWVYSSLKAEVSTNIARMIDFYNSEVDRWVSAGSPLPAEDFIDFDPQKISWTLSLRNALRQRKKLSFSEEKIRVGLYRPFNRQYGYFDRLINHAPGITPGLFSGSESDNFGFYLTSPSTHYPSFSVIATDLIPDLHLHDTGQLFARYAYRDLGDDGLFTGRQKVDNITDWALSQYQAAYGADVSKDDIFFYVYGLLHSEEYRTRYAADLRKALPRIPQVPGKERFDAFVKAGRQLSRIHIGYEDVQPYPLTAELATVLPEDEYELYAVTKMRYGGKAGAWDKTTIRYNPYITITGIPEEAQRYMLGSRSGLDWILERYKISAHKASGIVNDPNDWSREHGQPRYIIDLIGKITAVSLETMEIVDNLPDLGDSTGTE
ncbi:type ISP restriction/modification enzyme [Brevibacterium gallinarum]|uniref:type ISP restriction/modification enzyme n=1 Tax=Brevibacterium gallinarum TaxID=2762220 RepID=UPI00296AF62A|nr:type ISP restriction/modification enzyme [Brevibacterium gallinarum]